MSECVVRMEMPNGCHDCKLRNMVGNCPIPMFDGQDEKKIWTLEECFQRPPWCPIICQLPEGHGDLVDWKDVEKELDTSFCSVVDDGPCMGPYMLKRKEYPQALIERPIRVNIIVPAERSET